jgi:hypothetical protein
MRILKRIRKSNMLSLDLKGMQNCGGMNYRLTGIAKARKESKDEIEWLQT